MSVVLGTTEVAGLLDRAEPDQPAIVCGERRVDYGELAEQVAAVAAGLGARGIAPGDAVTLLADGPAFVLGFLAIARAGAVAVPLNPAFKPAEREFCLREAGVRAALVDREVALEVPSIALADAGRHAALTAPPPAPDADVVFTYSAGATGRPKRVPRTHAQLVAEAESFVAAAQLTPADTILCALPPFHTYGLGCCLLAALASGATLLFVSEPQPIALDRGRVLGLLEQATVFPAVPFQLRMLAEAPGGADLSGLRLCFSAGNALPRATFEAFEAAFGVAPRQLYGCTEAGVVTVNTDADPHATAGSVGTAVAGVELAVVGADGAPVDAGRLGEITIRSAAMTRGYAGVPARVNREAFPDGAFLTGDRGRVDEAGRLFLTGRRKRLIDVKGDKVDPVEVEDVLAVHPRVRDVVVVGAASGVEGEELVKAVVVAEERCTERELVRFCRERLADYKAPRIVEFREDIPRSSLGEVLRKYLV
jgi:long-chain acyl-CoA synthetase